ncbi:MAG: hypothetical protein HY938_06340 [Nitrosomonadales bacterium]|nr:hypothetical protein [Nitrosomonadales bacterium]
MATLDMAIVSSPRFAMVLLVLHSVAAISVSATAIPVVVKAAVLALILASLLYHLARDSWRLLPDSWAGITLDGGGVSITTRDGRHFAGQVEKMTVVCPCFVVLRITPDGHRRAVSRAVFPDALNGDEFRELCVRLKFA